MKHLIPCTLAALMAGLSTSVMASPVTPQHGAMELPIARQLACYNAQDFHWPQDGSGIRNLGCRAAYQHVYAKFGNSAEQAVYQFIQWHEVSKNVAQYEDMDAVKAAIPDGQLCSAGANVAPDAVGRAAPVNDKSGLDVAAEWPAQNLTKGADNHVTMRYKIAAPHNPSFWEIYVSKPGYDASERPLRWDDLELVQRLGDVTPVNGYYELDVDLKDIEGKRVIYSRWQREDSVGEGFYNCSDVDITAARR